MFGNTKKFAVGVLTASMVAATASTGVAQAAVPQCQASSVKVAGKGLLGAVQLNPFAVGVNQPCANASRKDVRVDAGVAYVQGLVNETSVLGGSHSQIAAAIVNLPGLSVQAYALETSAAAICGDASRFVGASRVAQLFINGKAIAIPANNASTVTTLPLGIAVYLNRVVTTPTGATVAAIQIVTPLADVTIAESRISADHPCYFGPIITIPTYPTEGPTPLP